MHSLNETIFAEIIEKKKLKPFFQPIVSLRNGKVLAYEALSRVTGKYEDISIGAMFDMATKLDCPWRLDKLCRSLAIKQASKKPKQAKLFLNVDSHVLLDAEFKQGFTQDSLRKYVKIDYELVHNIQKSKAQSSIVRLMVNYCREMHHVLIAEGECYDAFAVVDDNRYGGMVTVRDLVRTLAEGE